MSTIVSDFVNTLGRERFTETGEYLQYMDIFPAVSPMTLGGRQWREGYQQQMRKQVMGGSHPWSA